MKIEIVTLNGKDIAEVISDGIVIRETQDALDLMADCSYQGCSRIIIHEENIIPGFFDLKTRIAGDILQKFSTYNVRLAIVGDFVKFHGKSLRDFIVESNRYGRICFTSTTEEAREKLAH